VRDVPYEGRWQVDPIGSRIASGGAMIVQPIFMQMCWGTTRGTLLG
jgi:hypothetical protein